MGLVVNFPGCHDQTEPQQNEIPIEKATHWICKEINQHCEGSLTVGKIYEIRYDEMRDEFYMLDDCAANTVWFLVIEGDFVRM
ncbi:hypothetical protein [Desulfocucumis palustris]|uniref:hypothetical protein n=1 Tax=Desulfocucumis palustris TaxID=1898651 RepID=UPI000CEA2DBA|nr:hypothetical protein [Desulfocucumis palustris]